MGQKANPISLRLQQTNRHFDSCWYSGYFYSELITRDLKLQNYFNCILKQVQSSRGRFFIQNFQNKLKIHLFLCNSKASRISRSAFFRLPKPTLKSKLKTKSFTVNTFLSPTLNSFTPQSKSYGKASTIEKQNTSNSTTNFLNTYSLQNKKQSLFIFYLFRNLKNNYFLNFNSQVVINHEIVQVNHFLIRYIILNYFIRCQSNLIVSRDGLASKSKLFEWLPKKSRIFLILNYIKYKLYTHQKKSKNLFLSESKSFVKEKAALFKIINKQDVKNINDRRHKINTLFFKPEFQSPKSHTQGAISVFESNKFSETNKKNFVLKNSNFREHLESLLSIHLNVSVNTFFYLVSKESQSALFLADEIAYYLEKRVSFRAIKNKIMKELQQKKHSFFQGIRITCSGRVGGKSKKAQRSKIQTFKYGQTSLHVFSSKIDFAFQSANTSFGQVGIKVWVCYDLISPQPLILKA